MRKTLSRFVLALLVLGAAVHLLTGAQAQRLEEVGSYDTPGVAFGIALWGRYACVADGPAGLRVIDVSNPAQPIEVGFYPAAHRARRVTVSGGYAYVSARYDGLRVIDLSDPAHPRGVGFYGASNWEIAETAVSGSYAYVAAGYSGGFRVIDISNPAQPAEVGNYMTRGVAWAIAVWGNQAYVVDGFGLWVIDVTNPALPHKVGFYDTPGGAWEVTVSGGYAYVADGSEGLRVIDISNPAQLREVGSYPTSYAVDVVVSEGYAYVADAWEGLRVIDISDPTQPREVASYDTRGVAVSVTISGEYIYVADREAGLLILRFTGGARTYSVSGQVQLQDYQGDVTAVPVTVEVRQNGSVVRTEVLSLDAQGGYTLANLTPGTYELAFKANHWLRRVRAVEVVASDVLGVDVSLVNGDVDGDNEVGLSDFGGLVSAFGSTPGDTGWNSNADLDGDGEVSMSDFGILLRRFGEVGDQ